MYQAKMAGKNCYRYYSRAMDHAVERRVHMEQELRGAWERGELRLAYQPIFRMRDRRMVGVEVLLRWQHPTLGVARGLHGGCAVATRGGRGRPVRVGQRVAAAAAGRRTAGAGRTVPA
ncbi:hypothetical protein G6F57_019650 [Rhizopus arrhizus]|nr:hypothetical protein G6F62_014531 [Rhizopus arrhizus]KAG1438901.1 hypothetical protein G6F57_019650 [Rhizopus arrhizus]